MKAQMREQLLYYAVTYKGEWSLIHKAIERDEAWHPLAYPSRYITILDERYPQRLRALQYAPWVIFYSGNLALCEKAGVAIIGSRQVNAQGIADCERIVDLLKHRYIIISGLAKGIDGCAHQRALQNNTVAVVGSGLDISYPTQHADLQQYMMKHQLVLSEYPAGVKPLAYHFPWRNRLIAALSQAVIVIAAAEHSGTMLTVNEAITLDIPIYCIPHAFQDEKGSGGNRLIQQGANILVDEQDILMI